MSFDCWPEHSIELLPCPGIPPCEEYLQACSFNPHPIPTQLPGGRRDSSFKRWLQSPWREIRRRTLRCNRAEDWRRVCGTRSPFFSCFLHFWAVSFNDVRSLCLWLPPVINGRDSPPLPPVGRAAGRLQSGWTCDSSPLFGSAVSPGNRNHCCQGLFHVSRLSFSTFNPTHTGQNLD